MIDLPFFAAQLIHILTQFWMAGLFGSGDFLRILWELGRNCSAC